MLLGEDFRVIDIEVGHVHPSCSLATGELPDLCTQSCAMWERCQASQPTLDRRSAQGKATVAMHSPRTKGARPTSFGTSSMPLAGLCASGAPGLSRATC